MVPENFKENGFMIGLGLFIVVFVIAQSLFFLVKAWKQGKKLGITTDTLKNTVVSSALFTIAPAISILATVIVLANSLGIVLPWIRLSVIGNLAYEQSSVSGGGGGGGCNGGFAFLAMFAAAPLFFRRKK